MPEKVKIATICLLILLGLFFYSNSPGVQRLAKKNYYFLYGTLLPLAPDKNLTVKLDVPFHRQEHALSCEIATLKMVLGYYGMKTSENDLLRKLSFDTKQPRSPENIWGDADRGFVGNIDGKMPNTGYGVYEEALASLASQYRPARAFRNLELDDILTAIVKRKPVIVWGHVGSGRDISWQTKDGKKGKAIYGEHTRILVGFSGSVSDPRYLLLLDPIYGKIVLPKKKFLENWSSLDRRAVIVY